MRCILRFLLPAMIVVSPLCAIADDLEVGDDVSTTTSALPITWEPMITEFGVYPSHPNAEVNSPTPVAPAISADIIGEANQWLALKPLILPHKGSFRRDESVISGWARRASETGAVDFVIFNSGPQDGNDPGKLQSMYIGGDSMYVAFNLDILMNATPAKKDEFIKKHFIVTDLQLTAYLVGKVTKESRDFRAALNDDAKSMAIHRLTRDMDETSRRFESVAAAFAKPGIEWHFGDLDGRVPSIFEIRVKCTVAGRVNDQEKLQEKTVEGAARMMVVDDRTLEIMKLSESHMRKSGEKDIIKNGNVVGTEQKP